MGLALVVSDLLNSKMISE